MTAQTRRPLEIRPFTGLLDGAGLRYIRIGDVEVVRRIYVAVRDKWRTIPPQRVRAEVEQRDGEILVRCDAHHEEGHVVFDWHGTILLTEEGTTKYEMDCVTGDAFQYAKLSICLHHPMRTAEGPYHGTSTYGSVIGRFPEAIAPQIHMGDVDLPVFPPVTALTVMQTDEIAVAVSWNGERFEMEDHRNWSDASFKTYPKPADLGYRFHAHADERLTETVQVVVRDGRQAQSRRPGRQSRQAIRVEIGEAMGRKLPAVAQEPRWHRSAGSCRGRVDDLLRANGRRGIVSSERPSQQATPSNDAATTTPYPMFHVFADTGERKRNEPVELRVSDETVLSGIASKSGSATFVGIENLTEDEQRMELGPALGDMRTRRLTDLTYGIASQDPASFRSSHELQPVDSDMTLRLSPMRLFDSKSSPETSKSQGRRRSD